MFQQTLVESLLDEAALPVWSGRRYGGTDLRNWRYRRIDEHLDDQVVVVGAGVAGIYQIKRLAELGARATALDANADLGGTWYNNRYPGARFDSESYTGISFQ